MPYAMPPVVFLATAARRAVFLQPRWGILRHRQHRPP